MLTRAERWQWWERIINNQTNKNMNDQTLTELIYDLLGAIDATTSLTDTAREAILATLPQVNVYACKVDQAYGGREEGGWYYRTEQPLDRHIGRDAGYGYKHPERLTMRADRAIAYCNRANDLTDLWVNAERPSLSSVASIGKIHWQWTIDRPRCQPESKPYYC
jgi:hypothetical protein